MDVFFYWKDFEADMKAGPTGRFRASAERLAELQDGYPSYIWALKTPKGKKGELELVARLVWSDKPTVKFAAIRGDSHIFYDAGHPESVWYDTDDAGAATAAVTRWAAKHFPGAVSSRFQGANGQHAMRGAVIADLVSIARPLATRPFAVAPTEA